MFSICWWYCSKVAKHGSEIKIGHALGFILYHSVLNNWIVSPNTWQEWPLVDLYLRCINDSKQMYK